MCWLPQIFSTAWGVWYATRPSIRLLYAARNGTKNPVLCLALRWLKCGWPDDVRSECFEPFNGRRNEMVQTTKYVFSKLDGDWRLRRLLFRQHITMHAEYGQSTGGNSNVGRPLCSYLDKIHPRDSLRNDNTKLISIMVRLENSKSMIEFIYANTRPASNG